MPGHGEEGKIEKGHGRFETSDGLSLYARRWAEGEKARAAIALVHGFDEHSGRYERFAGYFAPRGFNVHACDLRGHGRSPGPHGHVDRFSDYLLDVRAFFAHVQREEPDRAVFLVGHSMGGLIVARFVQETPLELSGVVLSSPYLRLKMPVPPWKLAAASALSVVTPWLPMHSDIPLEWISHDKEVVEETRRDPLSHRLATPRWFIETARAQRSAFDHAHEMRAPLALLYAGADRIADPEASERFFQKVQSEGILRCYEGYYHEIFNEIGRDAVFRDLEAWLSARIDAGAEGA